MDIKEIAKKASEDGADVTDLTKDFDATQLVEFNKELKGIADSELATITARRKENGRLKTDADAVHNEAFQKAQSQIRVEQITKARSKFKSEMSLTDEQMTSIDDAFKSEDSGKFDADFIVDDFRKAYAKANAPALIAAQRAQTEQAAAAAAFNAQSAGGGSAGGGSEGNAKTYSPDVIAMVRESQKTQFPMTLDEAERGMKAGGKRVFEAK